MALTIGEVAKATGVAAPCSTRRLRGAWDCWRTPSTTLPMPRRRSLWASRSGSGAGGEHHHRIGEHARDGLPPHGHD